MLHVKSCHQGLKPRSRFLGLEPLDILLLCPGFYVASVILHNLVLAIVISVATAVTLRVLKWGRLPGYTVTLGYFLLLPQEIQALGHDTCPAYPTPEES